MVCYSTFETMWGSLRTAIEIGGLFIEKGPIVQVKYRDQSPAVNDTDAKYNGKEIWLF